MIKVNKNNVVKRLEQKIKKFFKIRGKVARLIYWRRCNYEQIERKHSCPLCALFECNECPADLPTGTCDSVINAMYKYRAGLITLKQFKKCLLAELAKLKQFFEKNKKN